MTLGIYNPIFALAGYLLFFLCGKILARTQPPETTTNRFGSIDGLRGYLAFSVFMHHSVIWYEYARTGVWAAPTSSLFRHLGESSVSLFFMITAFLFTQKVIASKKRPINWGRLYVNRLFRLLPMYLVAALAVWVLAWAATAWTQREPLANIGIEAINWLIFNIPGETVINGLKESNLLIAGVTWSLAYEWWFYLSLPMAAMIFATRPGWTWCAMAFINIASVHFFWGLSIAKIIPFAGGVAGAFLIENKRLSEFSKSGLASFTAILAAGCAFTFTRSAYTPISTALLSISFILIACGSDLFGGLSSNASKLLGESTYSIYLLHGLLLAIAFKFGFGVEYASKMSVAEHWLTVLAVSIPLTLLSQLCYRFIEAPGQLLGQRIANKFFPHSLHVAHNA